MNTTELPVGRRVCFHHIDTSAINESMEGQIRTVRGGGGGLRVLEKYCKELVEHAERHSTLHSANDELKIVETGMAALEQTYQQQGMPAAERHDRQYQKLLDQKSRLADDNFYRFSGTNRTPLSTNWDTLQSLGNPLLTVGGDDSQHLADWPTSD